MQYATQLYTLRSLPPTERCRVVADAGFDGVELVGLDATGEGLDVVAAHVDRETLESDPEETVERCRTNGTETVVVPSLDGAALAPERIDETATRVDALADAGGRLCYHNHEFEFERLRDDGCSTGITSVGRETAFDRLVTATTTLGFEVDVGWATAAGVDPVSLLERLGDRTHLVHLKDVRLDPTAPRGAVPVDLGAGDVDLAGVVTTAENVGVDSLVFEHDDPASPTTSVHRAAAWLGLDPSRPR